MKKIKLEVKRNRINITAKADILLNIDSSKLYSFKPNYTICRCTMSFTYDNIYNLCKQFNKSELDVSDEIKKMYLYEMKLRKYAFQINNDKLNVLPIDKTNLNKELDDYQLQSLNFIKGLKRCIIGLDMGLGKVQPITNKVLSENGWIEIGKLKIGDKIYNSQGTLSDVTGIFPQGIIKNYEVVFTDGSKTNCGEEHLWNVQTPNYRKRYSEKFITKTLKDIMNEGINTKHYHKRDKKFYYNNKWFIPMIKPIQWKENTHIIHPYNLGLLIGDGSLLNTVNLCNVDKEIQNKFIKLANCKVNRVIDDLVVLNANPYKYELQRLNLWGHKSPTKFIPFEYLHDSITNRINLLNGLMDTDGTVQGSNVSYSTKSLQLAKDVRYLIQSLGGTARINHKTVKCELYYNINIQLPENIIPFTTQYHLNRYTAKTKYKPYRAIKEVNYINDVEGVCIKTSANDSLYVTDDFILTHNTLVGLNAIKLINSKKTLIICPNYLKSTWVAEIKKWCPQLTYKVIKGTPAQRNNQFKQYEDNNINVLIINYEQIQVKCHKTSGKILEVKTHDTIMNTKFDLMICDEAHRLKNRKANVSNGVRLIYKKHIIFSTGTPCTKNPAEIYSLLNIIDNNKFSSYWDFVDYYCNVEEGFQNSKVVKSIKRPKEYTQLINRYMYRVLKQDIMNLPPKNYINIPVNLTKYQMTMYKQALKNYIKPNDDVIDSDVERFIRMLQIIQNPCIIDGKDESVIKDTIIDLLNDIPDRVLIGCTFIKMSENLQNSIQLKHKKRNVYLINSQIKNRDDIIEKFSNDKTGILVTTIKCLAEGVNMDYCNNIIYADIEWNCGVNNQFENRIHRRTSIEQKNYYKIIVENTLHEYKYNKIQNEANMAKQALNDSDMKIINSVMNDFKKDYNNF